MHPPPPPKKMDLETRNRAIDAYIENRINRSENFRVLTADNDMFVTSNYRSSRVDVIKIVQKCLNESSEEVEYSFIQIFSVLSGWGEQFEHVKLNCDPDTKSATRVAATTTSGDLKVWSLGSPDPIYEEMILHSHSHTDASVPSIELEWSDDGVSIMTHCHMNFVDFHHPVLGKSKRVRTSRILYPSFGMYGEINARDKIHRFECPIEKCRKYWQRVLSAKKVLPREIIELIVRMLV